MINGSSSIFEILRFKKGICWEQKFELDYGLIFFHELVNLLANLFHLALISVFFSQSKLKYPPLIFIF